MAAAHENRASVKTWVTMHIDNMSVRIAELAVEDAYEAIHAGM